MDNALASCTWISETYVTPLQLFLPLNGYVWPVLLQECLRPMLLQCNFDMNDDTWYQVYYFHFVFLPFNGHLRHIIPMQLWHEWWHMMSVLFLSNGLKDVYYQPSEIMGAVISFCNLCIFAVWTYISNYPFPTKIDWESISHILKLNSPLPHTRKSQNWYVCNSYDKSFWLCVWN